MNDVDQLIEQTSVNQVLAHYGRQLPDKSSGEHRLQCVFNDGCADSKYGNLTVKLNDTVNRIYCHTCGVRGNLLTLLHGLETHQPPTGGRLRGEEFKNAVAKLRDISGQSANNSASEQRVEANSPSRQLTPTTDTAPPPSKITNTPLHRHDKEAARELANLYNDLIVDVSEMSPEAAQYVRKRPWMTPELMKKWGVGWIPGNGRSLFRKNYLVYTHRNERGEVLSYSGRDLLFEKKWLKWIKDGKPESKKPNKHRYVSGYHKGQELYGGQAARLKEPYVRESLQKYGVVVVEGMNDVIRLEELGVASVGITSNKATDAQLKNLVRFAQQAANNRIMLLPDCDEEGEAGFKDLLWKLAEQQCLLQLASSSRMFDGQFAGRQPEDLTENEWRGINLTA